MAGKRKKKGNKPFLFRSDSCVQALGAVDHWSDMVMSQVQSSNAIVQLEPTQWFSVYQRRWVLSNVLSYFCISLCTVQASACGQRALGAELACWTVEFLSFGGVLILLALFSSGTDYVWVSWKHCIVDLGCSVCSTQLFCDGGMSGLTFPIWLVLRDRALLAGMSNHRYCGSREAMLTCCISHSPVSLTVL